MADARLPWLVLIHQLPPKPAYRRVKVWRRLLALGAIPIKSSVYVLPSTDEAREDFAWMLREIQKDGGEASVCEARLVEGLSDEALRAAFQAAREADYRALATDVRTLDRALPRRRGRALPPEQRAAVEAGLVRFRKRLAELAKIDFFGAPGRQSLEGLLRGLDDRLGAGPGAVPSGHASRRRTADVRGRVWVTRKGVHVDRMASAWLIRRFIDPKARLKFVQNRGYRAAPAELRFDMFEAEFTHDGDLCTFEVLLRDFGLEDLALQRIGEIIHDIDLKEAKFGRPEVAGIDHLVAGIAGTHIDDDARLTQAGVVFDGLYGYFQRKKDA